MVCQQKNQFGVEREDSRIGVHQFHPYTVVLSFIEKRSYAPLEQKELENRHKVVCSGGGEYSNPFRDKTVLVVESEHILYF